MSSSLPLSFNPPLVRLFKPHSNPNHLSSFPVLSKPSNSYICFALSPSNDSDYSREEARWLREEQRWLREEQRWLRQESRWNVERESLLREIETLKLRIQGLERQNSLQGASVSETVANVAKSMQVLRKEGELMNKVNQIAESGSSAVPMVEAMAAEEPGEVEEVVAMKEIVMGLDGDGKEGKGGKKMKTLRTGCEGEEVRAMQEALQKLGFYSGEEDMEYSSFSSGTERAVKTWQATLGASEDGIMTTELLEILYMEQRIGSSVPTTNSDSKRNGVDSPSKEDANGAAVASMTKISEIQQRVVKEASVEEVEVSHHRVFLLGENRWEEPSRLAGSKKQVDGANSKDATTKCISCRGEGRLLCTECDGTGEPNIEPQFLEWIDEATKCPYCEGLGYTVCDVCEGKTVIKA